MEYAAYEDEVLDESQLEPEHFVVDEESQLEPEHFFDVEDESQLEPLQPVLEDIIDELVDVAQSPLLQ